MEDNGNLILDELNKKKVSAWKRIAILLIDAVIACGVFLGLFYSLGTLSIKSIASNSITTINEIYKNECDSRQVPYKDGPYGIYELDKDKYIEMILPSCKSYEEAMDKYNDLYYIIDKSIQRYPAYPEAYSNFSTTYYMTLLISLLIPCLILFFIIPALNKRKKTIGMYITKTSLVFDKTNIMCSIQRTAIRFLTIFAIEIALVYAVAQIIGLVFVVIINIVSITLTKKRKGIHDLLTQVHVEKDEYSYTSDSE